MSFSLLGLVLCSATPLLAALDFTGLSLLVTSVGGLIVALVGLWRTRKQPALAAPDQPGQVAQVIELMRELERCRDLIDSRDREIVNLKAEILRLNDQHGKGRGR